MTNEAPSWEGRFVEVGWSFHGLPVCSRMFLTPRWMMHEKVLREVVLWCWPYSVDVDGLACPFTPAYGPQPSDEGIGHPARCHLVPSCSSGRWHFTGGYATPRHGYLWTCWLPEYLCHRVLHRACCFYHDMFALCWNHYGVYACILGRATISDSDGTGPSTRVYDVRCVWAPAAASYLIR
jgi:hypothetical protein